jgi:hypothetical protein
MRIIPQMHKSSHLCPILGTESWAYIDVLKDKKESKNSKGGST